MPGAIFLSYASQDATAARQLCEALRGAGVEVWFDQEGGLEHGDAWDAKIRRQIRECVLFIPLISENTQARTEGYFRIEWDLAAERSQGIAQGVPFILPVVIDATREPDALVPDRFRKVQWTRLPGGAVPPEVLTRLVGLWSHRAGVSSPDASRASASLTYQSPASLPVPARRLGGGFYTLIAAVIVVAGLGLGWWSLHRPGAPVPSTADSGTSSASGVPQTEADQAIARAQTLVAPLNYTRDDLAAADDLARKATVLTPDSAHNWAIRAWIEALYVLRGWDDSESRLHDVELFAKQALAFDPNEENADYALTVLYNFQKAGAQAEAYGRRGLALRPDDPRIYRTLAGALYIEGRDEEAFALQQECARKFPRDPLSQYGVAFELRRRGQYAACLERVNAGLALQPFPSLSLLKAAVLVLGKGDVAGAQNAFDEIPPLDRTEVRAVVVGMWLGLLERRSDRVEAAAALTAATYLTDFYSMATGPKAMQIAFAFHLEGKEALARQHWQAAETVLRQRLGEQAGDEEAASEFALDLVWQGRLDEAAREIAPIEAAAREQTGRSAQFLELSRYYASLGETPTAVIYLRQGLQTHTLTIPELRIDPWYDKLRGQPAYEALLSDPAWNDAGK